MASSHTSYSSWAQSGVPSARRPPEDWILLNRDNTWEAVVFDDTGYALSVLMGSLQKIRQLEAQECLPELQGSKGLSKKCHQQFVAEVAFIR
eukprot:762691-Hanusia_phi.AAC.4